METLLALLRMLGIILCIGIPAYAFLYFDDDNAEM